MNKYVRSARKMFVEARGEDGVISPEELVAVFKKAQEDKEASEGSESESESESE